MVGRKFDKNSLTNAPLLLPQAHFIKRYNLKNYQKY